jgi:hypothetical protein
MVPKPEGVGLVPGTLKHRTDHTPARGPFRATTAQFREDSAGLAHAAGLQEDPLAAMISGILRSKWITP